MPVVDDLPRGFFGLHVDLGDWHSKRHVWLAFPSARFACRWGCVLEASGPVDVAHLTGHLSEDHARICPGSAAQRETST